MLRQAVIRDLGWESTQQSKEVRATAEERELPSADARNKGDEDSMELAMERSSRCVMEFRMRE